jgi:hypothetical protein
MFPPGRARLATSPPATASPTPTMTMGSSVVACLAARAASGFVAKITSTLRRTSSAARAGRRSGCPSAVRNSIAMFWPSNHPRSRSPCRNASRRGEGPGRGELSDSQTMWGTFAGRCAPAASDTTRRPRARVTRSPIRRRVIVVSSRMESRITSPKGFGRESRRVGRACQPSCHGAHAGCSDKIGFSAHGSRGCSDAGCAIRPLAIRPNASRSNGHAGGYRG